MSFVKLFATLTDSSVWDLPDNVRVIWITMLAMANSRGRVHAAITGVANRSRKTVAEVEEALRVFTSPDPHSRTKEHDGRRVAPIDGGWVILNYEKHRAAKNAESVRESKRAYAARRRADESANLNDSSAEVEKVDIASNMLSVSVSRSDLDLRSDPDPRDQVATPRETGAPAVLRVLPDEWTMPESLRAEAIAAGVHPDDIDRRVAELRTGPIGGARGVRADKLDDYFRVQFPKWRTWGETERAKAQRDAAKGAPTRFGQGGAGQVAAAPKDERKRLPGMPAWVWDEHAKLAASLGLDLKRAVVAYARRENYTPVSSWEPSPADTRAPFSKFLQDGARVE